MVATPEIIRTDLRDNKSLGDEYVNIMLEVFERIKADHPVAFGNDYPHCIFTRGRKVRNIKDADGNPFNLVGFYVFAGGEMPYGIAYAKDNLMATAILKRLEIILLNSREQATNIIEDEFRNFFHLPPRTI